MANDEAFPVEVQFGRRQLSVGVETMHLRLRDHFLVYAERLGFRGGRGFLGLGFALALRFLALLFCKFLLAFRKTIVWAGQASIPCEIRKNLEYRISLNRDDDAVVRSPCGIGRGRRLGFSTWSRRRNITRYAALQRFDALAVVEADQPARDDGSAGCQGGKPMAHRRGRHAGLLGNLRIEPLTVSLQALQNFAHGRSLEE